MSEITDTLKWRYATKAFNPNKPISSSDWQQLEESLVLTPSSFGLQPWKFIIVDTPSIREQLVEKAWGQRQVADASKLVVFAHRKAINEDFVDEWLTTLANIQNKSAADLEGYKGMIMGFIANMTPEQMNAWNQRQTYIALGQLMTTAAMMKIDTCPLEGISPIEFDQILGLDSTDFTTSVACAVGYRSEDDKYSAVPKARFTSEQVIERR